MKSIKSENILLAAACECVERSREKKRKAKAHLKRGAGAVSPGSQTALTWRNKAAANGPRRTKI